MRVAKNGTNVIASPKNCIHAVFQSIGETKILKISISIKFSFALALVN